MLYAMFFLLGVFTVKFLQILFNIKPLYNLWKVGELGFLKSLLQSEMLRHQSLAILKVCYFDVDKEEEYKTIEQAVNKKFSDYQEFSLQIIKHMLPYETKYNNTEEAMKWLTEKFKNGELTDV